jgi:hypothetical protein
MPRMFGYLAYPPSEHLVRTETTTTPEAQTGSGESGKVRAWGQGRRRVVMPTETHGFPENVRFHAVDWASEDIPEDRKGYDLIIAFVDFPFFRGWGGLLPER